MCLEPDDLDDFAPNCEPVELCCSDEQKQAALDLALEIAERFTMNKWCPEELCLRFSGVGKTKLFLTEYTSLWLNTIESITFYDCDGTEISPEVDLDDITNHRYWIEISEGCFPCGRHNIEVCGTWGKSMPGPIRRAIISHAMEMLQPGSSGLISNHASRMSWEDFAITYKTENTQERMETTGYKELDDVYMLYINPAAQLGMSIIPIDENCFSRDCGIVNSRPDCSRGGGRCG